jgi:hypothetical protein
MATRIRDRAFLNGPRWEYDLENCSRYTESGVSDASVSAGRAEPIDESYP